MDISNETCVYGACISEVEYIIRHAESRRLVLGYCKDHGGNLTDTKTYEILRRDEVFTLASLES